MLLATIPPNISCLYLQGFLKALSILNDSYGYIYANFGEPLSVKEYFGRGIDRSIHNFGPVKLQDLTPNELQHIIHLAHNIIRKQQDLTILTCFNLVSIIINNHVMSCSTPLTLDNLVHDVEWLLPIMRGLNAEVAIGSMTVESFITKLQCVLIRSFVSDNVVHNINVALELHSYLITVTSEKNIKLLRIHSNTDQIDQEKLKGHPLTNDTMDIAVSLLLIQYYSNPCAHFLVNLAFILLVVECDKSETISLGNFLIVILLIT